MGPLRRTSFAAAVLAAALTAGACGSQDEPSTAPATTTSTAPPAAEAPSTTTLPEAAAPVDPPAPEVTTPAPVPITLPGSDTPIAGDTTYKQGDQGPEVAAIEARLTALGFRPGEVDGTYDAQTASAVMAFQKHEGLDRDGAAGPQTLASLAAAPAGAGPRNPTPGAIEVDLTRQVLFATTEAGTAIINISSGNGKAYDENGRRGVANTPTGDYTVLRRVPGYERAPLGSLYRPLYFVGGYAIHGSASVPGHPASHGCVRTANADQDWLWDTFSNGAPVSLYRS